MESIQEVVGNALPGVPNRDSSAGHTGTEQAVPLVASVGDAKVPAATTNRQQRKAGRTMSKRSGQSGSVKLVGSKWYGRYWRDVQGKEKREHPFSDSW